ncbi:MAG TPA: alpha/beta hydrolase [Steroidobacteraceae bacterium]|jgi:pimeloyl-ACP methyl ester carboxylesterase
MRRASLAALGMIAVCAATARADEAAPLVVHRTVNVDGVSIFYREAGPPDAPAVLLLHGFPSSSFMYRNLMPPLARRYRVIAPDYPGFGQSEFPPASRYPYTFERLARTMQRFTESVGLPRYALYIQDYGAPIGLRMALAHPERVTALIVQNGNAYAEGLSVGWDPLRAYWQEPTQRNREGLRGWLTADGIRQQYVAGVPASLLERFSPDTWTLDWSLLQRPGNIDVQLDLFGDYQHNVALYPQFQQMFRERQFPTLIVWGRHDVFFTLAGAQAYQRDLPQAELHLLDAGHFALETHATEIATTMLQFLARTPPR